MRKFKPVVRKDVELETPKMLETPSAPSKPSKPVANNKLPADTYKPVLTERSISLPVESDTAEYELRINVTRLGEFGLPHVDIRTWIYSPNYTGMTKRGINFPIEQLDEMLDVLTDIRNKVREKGLL